MYPVDWKCYLSVGETSYFEVKPTFWIPLVVSALSIASCPDTVMIVSSFDYSGHISWIEIAIEEDMWLSGFREVELVALRQSLFLVVRLLPGYFHFKTVVINFMKEDILIKNILNGPHNTRNFPIYPSFLFGFYPNIHNSMIKIFQGLI